MSRATLIRAGGTAAIAGGVLRAAASFVPNLGSDAERQVLYLVIDVCLLLGLLGFYELRHREIGRTGAVGFVLALVGLMLVRSSRAVPGLDLYPAGALAMAAGVIVMSGRAWRLKMLAPWVPGAFIASTLVGILGTFADTTGWLFAASGVLFGAAFAGLGCDARTGAVKLDSP